MAVAVAVAPLAAEGWNHGHFEYRIKTWRDGNGPIKSLCPPLNEYYRLLNGNDAGGVICIRVTYNVDLNNR